jgi:hypothetical protein
MLLGTNSGNSSYHLRTNRVGQPWIQLELEFLEEDVALKMHSDLPLIRTLYFSVAKWSRGHGGDLIIGPSSKRLGSPRSGSGIYAVLKRFFRQASKTAQAAALDAPHIHSSGIGR